MVLYTSRQIGSGCYGRVFLQRDTNRAVKIFYKQDIDKCWLDKIYSYERNAFEIATAREELRACIPAYYGQTDITKVILNGNDISDQLHLDLNYSMECLKGSITAVRDSAIERLFTNAGIFGVDDFLTFTDYVPPKIIDFSLKRVEKMADNEPGDPFIFWPP